MSEEIKIVKDDPPKRGRYAAVKRMAEIGVAEREMSIWDALAYGKTIKETAEELNLSVKIVRNAFKKTLERIEMFAEEDAEEWRRRQLLILNQQVSRAMSDAEQKPEPFVDEEGNQMLTQMKTPKWMISPMEAAKIRNMGGNRLMRALETQAKLLNLVVQRHEVDIEQKSLVVIRGDRRIIEGI